MVLIPIVAPGSCVVGQTNEYLCNSECVGHSICVSLFWEDYIHAVVLLFVCKREAKLTKLSSHPGRKTHQYATQCRTGIDAQTGDQKNQKGDSLGRYVFRPIKSMPKTSQEVRLGGTSEVGSMLLGGRRTIVSTGGSTWKTLFWQLISASVGKENSTSLKIRLWTSVFPVENRPWAFPGRSSSRCIRWEWF